MSINALQIHNFRNLTSIDIQVSPHLNVIYGENGSGKTSFLEALYYLSHSRSFRASQLEHLIQDTTNHFNLFALIHGDPHPIPVGISRDIRGARKIRLDGQSIQNVSTIAELLPIQFISTESHRLFHEGPKKRRQFMDWGVFHVEPRFFSLWQDLQQVIKQRNACIKQRGDRKELEAWNHQLTDLAKPINAFRKSYILALEPLFNELLSSLINIKLSLSYYPGWNEEKDLFTLLQESFFRELQLGYTYYGPNRADLQVLYEHFPAQNYLSQGQQKIVAYTLYLAQGKLMQQLADKQPIYLIDDLPSELDSDKRKAISSLLASQQSQLFVTGITRFELSDLLATQPGSVFQLKSGVISNTPLPTAP